MSQSKTNVTKKGFGSVLLFYFLVAFEFAYMAGPFAIYFYSVYSPVLNFFNKIPALSWMIKFFLPHIARETSSPVIGAIEVVGIIFTVVGFLFFIVGACQIYYSKLARKGAVLGGLYKFVRHPQYSAFIVCSFGLMLLWPRYIVVILDVTLLFAYLALARAEEKECEEKFGESYIAYEKKTGRFFPHFGKKEIDISKQEKRGGFFNFICRYVITLAIFLLVAVGLNNLTINSLYGVYTEKSATVSLCELDTETAEKILEIAKNDEGVKPYLSTFTDAEYELNYILPTDWFAAEVPMNGVVYRSGHQSDQSYDHAYYKVIFTKATLNKENVTSGKEILEDLVYRKALVEVHVDVENNEVVEILQIPETEKYEGIPVAIY